MDGRGFEQVSTLQGADWNDEWRRLQQVRRAADGAAYWDARAKDFDTDRPSVYSLRFLELAGVRPGERVLDMGCGPGTLGVPLAQRGCQVIAADFSAGMLEQLTGRVEAASGDIAAAGGSVTPLRLAWEDDWDAAGVEAGCADVALASRSIATADLRGALLKLHAAATRRCCVTLSCGSSPRMDPRVLEACGVRNAHGRDHQYAWNILVNEGLAPEVRYIRSVRDDTFDDLDDACAAFGRMIDDAVDPEDALELARAKAALRTWLSGELVPNEHAGEPDSRGGVQRALRTRVPREVAWAFISWDK